MKKLATLLGKPGAAPPRCTYVRLWLTPSQAPQRVKTARELGISYVEAKRCDRRIMVRFAIPHTLSFEGRREIVSGVRNQNPTSAKAAADDELCAKEKDELPVTGARGNRQPSNDYSNGFGNAKEPKA